MSQIPWLVVKDVLYEALILPEAERSDYLDSACGENQPLRSEVEEMLSSYDSGFLEEPILAKLDRNKIRKTTDSEPLLTAGRTLSHYRIVQMLGRGGMGEVYLADDTALGRTAAIKVLHGDSGFGEQSATRLLREARSAAKLGHPNICQVYEVGEADGHPFIAMEYVEGEMLDTLIRKDRIEFDDAVSYARQAAAALGRAHRSGIVHRDIKPANIIVDAGGQIKVLDFGLAKETLLNSEDAGISTIGLIAGTVTYMSPEHLRGQEVDARTDVWSLGVVFYQMVTGRLPFRGETRADLIASILNDEIIGPGDVPPAAKYIFERALAKDISLRYATIAEFEADLAELSQTGTLRTVPALIPATAAATVPFPFARYAFTAAVLIAIAGGGFGFWRYRSANAGGRSFSGAAASVMATTIFDQKLTNAGVASGLSFSPDGSMLAFQNSDAETRTTSVYVQRVAGGEPVRVTGDGSVCYSPVWSPDGQRIAFLMLADDSRSFAVWSVSFTGGEPSLMREIGAVNERLSLLKWSNDGTALFIGTPENIDRLDIATGNVVPISLNGVGGTGYSASIAPDETRVAAHRKFDGGSSIWVKSIDANDARMILDDPGINSIPEWFSDGQQFAYAAKKDGVLQIFVQGIDGSPPRQATFGSRNTGDPAVSPAGGRIAYIATSNEANLFVTDIGSGAESHLTSKTTVQMLPAVSPDGRQVAYNSVQDPADPFTGVLKVEPFGQPDNAPAALSVPDACCAKWLPDGSGLIFSRKNGRTINLWKLALDGRTETQISTGGISQSGYSIFPFRFVRFPAELSVDGSSVNFVSGSSGTPNIWTAKTDGSGETMITGLSDKKERLYSPRSSPDGSRIAVIRAGDKPAGEQTNRIAFYENGRLRDGAEFNFEVNLLGWATAGDGVFASTLIESVVRVYFVRADGSRTKRLVATLPDAAWYSIRMSPDANWIVYTRRTGGVDDLYIVSASGGQPRRVTNNSDPTIHYSGVNWTPDGRSLIYSKQSRGMQINLLTDIDKENTK